MALLGKFKTCFFVKWMQVHHTQIPTGGKYWLCLFMHTWAYNKLIKKHVVCMIKSKAKPDSSVLKNYGTFINSEIIYFHESLPSKYPLHSILMRYTTSFSSKAVKLNRWGSSTIVSMIISLPLNNLMWLTVQWKRRKKKKKKL